MENIRYELDATDEEVIAAAKTALYMNNAAAMMDSRLIDERESAIFPRDKSS